MPIYEYECQSCGYRFERYQKMSDLPILVCPKCGAPVRKLISAGTGVIFKGKGFYVTDYGRQSGGRTCCGRTERCETPPCSDGEGYRK